MPSRQRSLKVMVQQGSAKVQHYVPQFLLRNFGTGGNHQLHVFDKQTERTFVTRAKNVACESRFYDFLFEDHMFTLEPGLSELESKAKPLFQRVLNEDSLTALFPEDRAVLSSFFAIQFTRSRWFRELWRSLSAMLGSKLVEYIRVPDENQAALETARFIVNEQKEFAFHFANKIWLLLETDRKTPFLIGDNPLALQNSIDMGYYGNIGLAVRGIEIYFPLSPIRALALWCPSHGESFRKVANNLRSISQIAPHVVAAHDGELSAVEQTVIAMDTGQPLQYKPENVVNFNSLQICYAERYVFSCVDDFALAREMIASHPDVRTGPRARMS